MQLKIVRFKQGITYLLYVAAVNLEDPLSVLLRFVKEHFGFISEYHLITRQITYSFVPLTCVELGSIFSLMYIKASSQ